MKYNRIFTFGCSWTKYCWPTWADMFRYTTASPILHNWGFPGIGNVGILYKMIECDLKNNFQEDDLIIVQWSAWTREDRYVDCWQTYGNVFNNPFYTEEFTKNYWSWDNDVIKNASSIISANKMFNIGYQFNMVDYKTVESGQVPSLDPLHKKWHDSYYNALPALDCFPNHVNTQFNMNTKDGHPDIKTGIYFFNNYIRPKFPQFDLGDNLEKLIRIHEDICAKFNVNQNYDIQQKISHNEIIKLDPNWNFEKEGI